jgi:hypothetical protein
LNESTIASSSMSSKRDDVHTTKSKYKSL